MWGVVSCLRHGRESLLSRPPEPGKGEKVLCIAIHPWGWEAPERASLLPLGLGKGGCLRTEEHQAAANPSGWGAKS